MRDRRYRPMSHDDSYGPQLYIPAGCSGEVARPGQVDNSFDGSNQKQL